MAKITGTVRFRGKLGEFVGKRRNGKDIISLPGGFDSERLRREKNTTYKNSWNQSYQFGRASKFARAIYYGFIEATSPQHQSEDAYARLTGLLNKLNKLDHTARLGNKKPTPDAVSNLRRFVFNPIGISTWKSEPKITTETKEKLTISIQNPSTSIKWPFEASILDVIVTSLKVNIPQQTIDDVINYSFTIPRESSSQPATFDMPLFKSNNLIAIALQFNIGTLDTYLPIQNKTYAPLHIIDYIK